MLPAIVMHTNVAVAEYTNDETASLVASILMIVQVILLCWFFLKPGYQGDKLQYF
jgi:hypothetical protein